MKKQMRNLKQFLKVTKNIRLMKSLYQTLKHVSIVVVLSIFLFLLNSCSQDDYNSFGMGESSYTYTGELIPVTIGNVGIDYFGSGAVTRSGETKVMSSYREPLDDEYDLVTEVESVPESEQPVTRGNLGNTVRFRILAYKNNAVSTANYVGQADYYINGTGGIPALVNESKALSLFPGTYKFVCYSFNTNSLATLDGTSATTIPVTNGQDFLSCVLDNVNVNHGEGGQFTLPIIKFRRLCSQIQIIVNSVNGENITACSARVQGLSGNQEYSIGNTELPTAGTGGTADVSWSSLPASIANSNYQCVLPNSSRTITISLTFTIGGTVYSNKTITLTNRAFAVGTNYKVTVRAKKNYVIINGFNYKVALGNVGKIGSIYRFGVSQGENSNNWNGGWFFNWGTADPLNYTVANTSYKEDVCKKVGSQWRTPNKAEMTALVKCPRVWGMYRDPSTGNINGIYIGTSTVPTDERRDNYVFLPSTGYRRAGKTTVASTGITCEYWTSTPDNAAVYLELDSKSYTIKTEGMSNNGLHIRCIANK